MANKSHAPKTAMIVARRIVRDIDRLSLRQGDKLPPERVMLEEYQVGRGTLRESLRFLELQGIISLKPGPGGGPVVEQPEASSLATSLMLLLQFSDAQYRVVAEARVALEPMMARLAAERMTPESLAELQPGSLKHARCRGTNATVRFGSLFQWDFFAAQVSRLPLH